MSLRGRTSAVQRLQAARPWLIFAAVVLAVALVRLPLPAEGPNIAPAQWSGAPPVHLLADQRPRPQRAESPSPLGIPPAVPGDAGPYRFMATQPGDPQTPVSYDPCRTLRYVVNSRTAPPGASELVTEAIAQIERATGLRFVQEGPTDEPAVDYREAYQRQRFGNRWAPILIAWSDPGELAVLDGDVAGIAGSTAVQTGPDGPLVYVSGIVAFDGPQLSQILAEDPEAARRIVLHELGHLVGLDHVADPDQVMSTTGTSAELAPGDLAGLARLGAGPCVPLL